MLQWSGSRISHRTPVLLCSTYYTQSCVGLCQFRWERFLCFGGQPGNFRNFVVNAELPHHNKRGSELFHRHKIRVIRLETCFRAKSIFPSSTRPVLYWQVGITRWFDYISYVSPIRMLPASSMTSQECGDFRESWWWWILLLFVSTTLQNLIWKLSTLQ